LDHSEFETLHTRYQQQAEWTRTIRETILSEIGFNAGDRLLEIGSGTGVITRELSTQFQECQTIGLDILYPVCVFANQQDPRSIYLAGNGLHSPFRSNSFVAVLSHFLLMWVPEIDLVLREMVRLAHPGGWVLAFAEPDYGGRIDNPREFEEIGHLQAASLEAEGADPLIGRKLRGAFHRAGLDQIRVGILGAEWSELDDPSNDRSEWQTLIKDISRYLPSGKLSALEKADQAARTAGERILFVPTFYAIGKVPIN
jgi:ubiquinone/menaquinone biosynthesis C-methylase UbiE